MEAFLPSIASIYPDAIHFNSILLENSSANTLNLLGREGCGQSSRLAVVVIMIIMIIIIDLSIGAE